MKSKKIYTVGWILSLLCDGCRVRIIKDGLIIENAIKDEVLKHYYSEQYDKVYSTDHLVIGESFNVSIVIF